MSKRKSKGRHHQKPQNKKAKKSTKQPVFRSSPMLYYPISGNLQGKSLSFTSERLKEGCILLTRINLHKKHVHKFETPCGKKFSVRQKFIEFMRGPDTDDKVWKGGFNRDGSWVGKDKATMSRNDKKWKVDIKGKWPNRPANNNWPEASSNATKIAQVEQICTSPRLEFGGKSIDGIFKGGNHLFYACTTQSYSETSEVHRIFTEKNHGRQSIVDLNGARLASTAREAQKSLGSSLVVVQLAGSSRSDDVTGTDGTEGLLQLRSEKKMPMRILTLHRSAGNGFKPHKNQYCYHRVYGVFIKLDCQMTSTSDIARIAGNDYRLVHLSRSSSSSSSSSSDGS